MKKIILIALFSIGMLSVNSQQKFSLTPCGCNGPILTWNAPSGLFIIKYIDCGGAIEMVSFDWTGTGNPAGWMTAMKGFNEFFDQYTGTYSSIKLPANCLMWVQTGKKWVAGENTFTPTFTIALCDVINGASVGCCELNESQARSAGQYMLGSPDDQCESASQNVCFKICGYAD